MKKFLNLECRLLFVSVFAIFIVACGGSGATASKTGSTVPHSGSGDAATVNRPPTISGQPIPIIEVDQYYEFQPVGSDLDVDDMLVFSIASKPVWLKFDVQTGLLSGTATAKDVGQFNEIDITVSDGLVQRSLPPFSIVVENTEVERAIASGDATEISSRHLLEDAILATLSESSNLHRSALLEIFNLQADGEARTDGRSLTAIDWNPTHDSAWLRTEFGQNVPLLVTNSAFAEGFETDTQTMGVLGESASRYIALGGNPMRNYRRQPSSMNEQMHQFLTNSVNWLTRRQADDTATLNVVIAHQDQSYYFPDELAIREWLDERYANQVFYNGQDACEGEALAGCIQSDTDLVIISQHQHQTGHEQPILATVSRAMQSGVPIFYLHHDGGLQPLGEGLLQLLDITWAKDNYWQRLGFSSLDPTTYIGKLESGAAAFKQMVNNFKENSFTIDWGACDGENCNANQSLATEFWEGARYAQSLMNQFDSRKVNIFKQQDKYRLPRLMALLGDHYRADVQFPLDRTSTTTFLRAFYADHVNYQYREKVGVWSDLGTFSRTDFSHITPTDRTVSVVSKRHFRSTGAYALPGVTVTATRTDSSEVNVEVFVNSLRSGSTHVFAEDGYTRPRFLQGEHLSITPGETIQFTSSTGGPIQLGFDSNDKPVEVKFANIGEHAYWSDAEHTDRFSATLFADEYDWAELVAPGFEVHSKREKMIESIDDQTLGNRRGSPQALVDATMRYIHNYPHILAGFTGPGIDVVDEIHQFARNNNIAVESLDLVKHMNADQATCGYGCSGNPYDAYWSFSPLGHGDLHELGHGLERVRFRLSGWPGHASTNFYSYYSKTRYHRETGGDPNCQSLPFEQIFNVLNTSLGQPDPSLYVRENLWNVMNWSHGTTMFIQMMMATEDVGALQDGWHLLARLHLIERAYQRAIRNDDDWQAARAGLGMNEFDRQSARNLSPEDWLLIAVSHASGYDFSDYFKVWAHPVSVEAGRQVDLMTLPLMPLNYYVSSGDGYCRGEGFDGNKLALDGQQDWPADLQSE